MSKGLSNVECRQCYGGGCAYCEGWFVTPEELSVPISVPTESKSKDKTDYELLQIMKQESDPRTW